MTFKILLYKHNSKNNIKRVAAVCMYSIYTLYQFFVQSPFCSFNPNSWCQFIEVSWSLVNRQAVQCGGSGGQRLAECARTRHPREVPVGVAQVERLLQKALQWSVKPKKAG